MATPWLFQAEPSPSESVPAKSSQEELFVFGYACKVFRDDEKARNVDQGKYLIPWMGDDRLMIDRYDGRGHLYDLSAYDADKVSRERTLSEEEKKLEALCDEERYLELHTDVAEKAMYEEEEWKRYYESLSEGYKAVGFSYDYYSQGAEMQEMKADPDEDVYVPAPELQVPEGMTLPDTVKANAIIEKTAKFIAEHGAQMEIIMKTRQANNQQFEFMHFEDELHPYYKHMVKMIKAGKYKPKAVAKEEEEDGYEDGMGEDGHHGYLHPTLVNRSSPTPEVYKPVPLPKVSIHETPYGQLLQSLTKSNQEAAEKVNSSRSQKVKVKEEPPADPEESGVTVTTSMTTPIYGPARPGVPPPPGIEPVTLPSQQQENGQEVGHVKEEEDRDLSSPDLAKQMLEMNVIPPPPDVQPIIDRMAMYVAKNGAEFEMVVKSKKDPRFEFLQSWHVHFTYYDFKKHLFIQEMEREKAGLEREKEEKAAIAASRGVSFKVKAKDQEQVPLEKKKVFEYETSDEEHDGESGGTKEGVSKTDISGTSTPLNDTDQSAEVKSELPPDLLEKKQAEQRVKDRLVASAREKLIQVDKEKQLQAERKRKAAMFINMLKTTQPAAQDGDSSNSKDPTSGTCTPERKSVSDGQSRQGSEDKETSSSRHSKSKSKHKSRDKRTRSRSREGRTRSRSKSKSRSPSRSRKRKKRSPTPPSAYAVSRRPPPYRPPPPPPPPPRYRSPVKRDHSPEDRHKSSRSRLKSKSKKKKSSYSKSPHRSKSESERHHRSKKKKKGRSSSRSPSRKSKKKRSRSRSKSRSPASKEIGPQLPEADVPAIEDNSNRVASPEPTKTDCTEEPVPDVERPESRLEDGEIDPVPDSPARSASPEPEPEPVEMQETSVQDPSSPSNSSRSRSRSRSRSPLSSDSPPHTPPSSPGSPHSTPNSRLSPRIQDPPDQEDSRSLSERSSQDREPAKNVSQYMLSRVRALIKASREAVLKEDGPLDDP